MICQIQPRVTRIVLQRGPHIRSRMIQRMTQNQSKSPNRHKSQQIDVDLESKGEGRSLARLLFPHSTISASCFLSIDIRKLSLPCSCEHLVFSFNDFRNRFLRLFQMLLRDECVV